MDSVVTAFNAERGTGYYGEKARSSKHHHSEVKLKLKDLPVHRGRIHVLSRLPCFLDSSTRIPSLILQAVTMTSLISPIS